MSEQKVERTSVRASPETLRVRGWRWQAPLFGVLCVEVGVVAVFVGSLVARGLFNWTAVGLGGALLLAAGGGLALLVRRDGIREVAMTSRTVEFVLGRETITVPWSDLEPPRNRLFVGDIAFYFPKGLGPKFERSESNRGHVLVTRDQAVAILGHPDCPGWRLDQKIVRSLGIADSPRA
jgi:hypothetical protein